MLVFLDRTTSCTHDEICYCRASVILTPIDVLEPPVSSRNAYNPLRQTQEKSSTSKANPFCPLWMVLQFLLFFFCFYLQFPSIKRAFFTWKIHPENVSQNRAAQLAAQLVAKVFSLSPALFFSLSHSHDWLRRYSRYLWANSLVR